MAILQAAIVGFVAVISMAAYHAGNSDKPITGPWHSLHQRLQPLDDSAD